MNRTQKLYIKFKTYYFLLIFLPFAFCLLPSVAHAQTMENGMYKIQVGDLNSASETINDTIDQNPEENTEAKYTVASGSSQDNSKPGVFKFSIQNSIIDFGTLSPTNPQSRTTKLSIINTSSDGYKVTVEENHKLKAFKSNAMIPDTTCDDGKCNETSASRWTNILTYGFGYRCDSKPYSCVKDDNSFKEKDYYKNFPDISAKESATTLLSGVTESSLDAIITYKVNISSSQPADVYSNTIRYLVIPSY